MKFRFILTFAVILVLSGLQASAQRVISGTVTDKADGRPLQYVLVYFSGTTQGTVTDEKGHFILENIREYPTLIVEMMGYESKEIALTKKTKYNVSLAQNKINLNAATIKPRPATYRRKGNPAVDLMRKVIDNKDKNQPSGRDNYQVEEYDKLSFALNDFRPDYAKIEPLSFAKAYVDTSELSGKPVLTVSVRETLSDVYERKSPRAKKTIIKAKRTAGFDKDLDPNGGITSNLEILFKNINIYKDDIEIFTEHFVGPISNLGIAYYKYYITDTTNVNDTPCTEISFVPSNSSGFGFTGQLYVANDGSNALRLAILNTPYKINLNWVDAFRFEQEFSPLADSSYVTTKSVVQMNLSLNGSGPSIYAVKTATYKDYRFNIDDTIFEEGDNSGVNSFDLPGAKDYDDTFWQANRHIALSQSEKDVEKVSKGLWDIPLVEIGAKFAEILLVDFIPTSFPREKSKIDIGNISAFIGYNAVEGFRMRLGAQTTAVLHPRLGAAAYVGYGVADKKFKYMGKLVYSFDDKFISFDEHLRHRLTFKHEYNVFSAEEDKAKDNIYYSFKFVELTTYMQYIRNTSLAYEKEWKDGLTLTASIESKRFEPAGELKYIDALSGKILPNFNVLPMTIGLRYAPGEKLFNGTKDNQNIAKNVPIFNLSHSFAPNNLLGADYGYNRTDFSFWKRTWMSAIGVVDTKVKAGYIWDKVPYPLLIIPSSSNSTMMLKETFHLMKPFEFVCDKYVSVNLTYRMKGFLFNMIPLLKNLKWREVITFDAIWGGLSDRNNPASKPEGLFVFPKRTRPFNKVPYMEVGFGIEDIFRIFHAYWFHRINYLDTPNLQLNGLCAGLHLDF